MVGEMLPSSATAPTLPMALTIRFTKGSRTCGSASETAKNSTASTKNATDARNTSLESPACQALPSSAYRRKIRSFMR